MEPFYSLSRNCHMPCMCLPCETSCRSSVIPQPGSPDCKGPDYCRHLVQDLIHCHAEEGGTHTHHEGIHSHQNPQSVLPLAFLNIYVVLCVLWCLQSSSVKRPVIPTEFGAKVPTNIRQRYLNTFIDECVKFCPSEDSAFQMV